jgi:hypothetical protein
LFHDNLGITAHENRELGFDDSGEIVKRWLFPAVSPAQPFCIDPSEAVG